MVRRCCRNFRPHGPVRSNGGSRTGLLTREQQVRGPDRASRRWRSSIRLDRADWRACLASVVPRKRANSGTRIAYLTEHPEPMSVAELAKPPTGSRAIARALADKGLIDIRREGRIAILMKTGDFTATNHPLTPDSKPPVRSRCEQLSTIGHFNVFAAWRDGQRQDGSLFAGDPALLVAGGKRSCSCRKSP